MRLDALSEHARHRSPFNVMVQLACRLIADPSNPNGQRCTSAPSPASNLIFRTIVTILATSRPGWNKEL
jgi:hypothetical protein